MSADLILTCNGCAQDYGRFLNLPLDRILALAAANGWERRSVRGYVLDLCPCCQWRDDAALIAQHTGSPF